MSESDFLAFPVVGESADGKATRLVPKRRKILIRSRADALRWLLGKLEGGCVIRAISFEAAATEPHGAPAEKRERPNKKPGRRRSRPRLPGETEEERIRRLARERQRKSRARRRKEQSR